MKSFISTIVRFGYDQFVAVMRVLNLDPCEQTIWEVRNDYASTEQKQCKHKEDLDDEPEEEHNRFAVSNASTSREFTIELAALSGPVLFDFQEANGTMSIVLNSRHPLADMFQELVLQNSASHKGMAQIFHAWALLESSAGDARRRLLEDIRYDLGRVARRSEEPLAKPDAPNDDLSA